jgi:hypothetical protein
MAAFSFTVFLDQCKDRVEAEPDHDWKAHDLTVLNRWREHAFANGAWDLIHKAATQSGGGGLWPGDFVEFVLTQARVQKRLVEEVVPQSAHFERKRIAEAEKEWRASRNGIGATAAGIKRDAAIQHRFDRIRVLGRQSNPRKRLILLCRELFIANCGQPLDEVTEMLVFVIFGSEAGGNEVRDALKASTRSGRTPKTKNSRRVSHRDWMHRA